MQKLYLSGPMTGYPKLNKPAFFKMSARLRRAGYVVVNPAELDNLEACNSWAACLRRDLLALLMWTEAIATLPGWEGSRGANLEVHVGKLLGYPVHPVAWYLRKRG